MKTKLLTLLTLLCITLSYAQTFTVNDLDYNVISTNPNEVEITGGTNIPNNLVIPDIVNDGTDDFTVTSIGPESFRDDTTLFSVTIPSTVTTIGDRAFTFCGLTSVSIPNSVITIGIATFRDNNLTNVSIPNSVTSLGAAAFQDNDLTSVSISESVTVININTFLNNALTSVTIPESVQTISNGAFSGNALQTINCLGNNPATIFEENGTNVDSFGNGNRPNIDLFVPIGLETTYLNGGWTGFNSITETTCFQPTNLNALNITANSADLSWIEDANATLWDIELLDITNGETQTGTPTNVGLTNTTFTATGLVQNNNYAFFVRADCGADGTSSWAGPFNFTTSCSALTAPYIEDFESFTTSSNAFVEENCWTATGGSYFWEAAPATDTGSDDTGPDPSITTGNYFYTEASDGSTGDITDLVSPLVDLTNLTTPTLIFNYHMFGSDIGTLDVLVNGTDNVLSLSGQQQTSATNGWEFAVIDLAAYAGQSIFVTFRGTSAGTFEGDIAIDNVVFDELPSCLSPSNLAANNITDAQADLSWTENGTATVWDIELLDITAGETATGTPTFTGISNPFTATGLTQDNDYAFFVRANCGGGDFSNWAGPFPFKTLETCPRPSALTAANITDSSVDLGWTENGTATLYNIELLDSTAGDVVTGTPTNSGLTTSSFAATGLTPANDYQFFVQADCGTGGVSAWVGPFSFTTAPLPPACGGVFVDTGGSSGNYSNDELYSTTILPDTAGQVVSITFTYVDIESSIGNGIQDGCWDFLTIYDGPDNTFPVLAQTLCGEESGDSGVPSVASSELNIGDTFTSTDPSGALTIVFDSDGSVSKTGWEATISCATLGTDEFNDTAFTYYPNPVKNTLTLNAKQSIDTVILYNMLGQNVLKAQPNSLNSDIDMSGLQNGTYFVKVTINSVTETIRVIKQ